ncbi:MAG: hypothetical protein ACFE8M_10570 [Candidatus Hermodarchaeota archaeon]
MKCEICGMENAKLRVKDLYYHKKCLLQHGEKREISEIKERGEFKEVGKKRYCNKCQAEIQPIKESKTLAKSFVNFLSYILFRGTVYNYPRRCPNCGKVLRTKGQIISGIICIAIVLTISIIILFATR